MSSSWIRTQWKIIVLFLFTQIDNEDWEWSEVLFVSIVFLLVNLAGINIKMNSVQKMQLLLDFCRSSEIKIAFCKY